MTKKIILSSILSLGLVTSALADFGTGDKFQCTIDQSKELIQIKIIDLGDEDAYVLFKGPEGRRFYPVAKVEFNLHEESAEFVMWKDQRFAEMVQLRNRQPGEKVYRGSYTDLDGSRAVVCRRR